MVEGVHEDPKNWAIVSATRGLAQAFGLEVGAEGVETAEEMEAVRLLGCDFVQGHYRQEQGPGEGAADVRGCACVRGSYARERGPAEEMEKVLTGSLSS